MDTLRQDFRFALRGLRRAPSVTLLIIGSLALAIAGNTVVFSLINGFLFRPLPYPQPERIVLVGEYQQAIQAGNITPASAANYLDWRERQTTLSEMAAYTSSPANLGDGDDRGEPVNVASVTPGFFPLLGAQPAFGRPFTEEEGTPGNDRVVLLTHGLWQSRFAGDRSVVGETLTLSGQAYTVVGVLPEDFDFLDSTVDLYTPLALDPAQVSRQQRSLIVLGRLAPGVSSEEADAEMVALGQQLAQEYPEANRGYQVQALNLRHQVPDSRNRQLFALLQGALIFVLLIACANIANLLLARAQGRVTEIAVRSSMGAGRSRIVRQLATESMVMASIGGLLGLGLGTLGTDLMGKVLASSIPRFWIPAVDGRVVLFTVGVTLLAGLLFGLAPALQTARLNVGAVLKEGGRGTSVGGRRRLVAKGLVVAEIALALVLLGGAGVLIRSFLDLQHTDPGFATDHLLTLGLTLPAGSDPAANRTADVEEVLRRIEALPGVTAAAAASIRPRFPGLPQVPLTVEASPPPEGQAPPSVSMVVASSSFLETLAIPLAQGRFFDSQDGADTVPVAVINETLAQRFWPDQSPIGQRITLRGESRQIVGIAGDANHSMFLTSGTPPTVYLPLAQTPRPSVAVTLRTAGDPALLANPVREAISGYDRGLVVTQVQTLEEFEAQFYVGMQLFTAILGGFGSLALLLAALGTYGVLAYAVAQRSHEIGVRMAIGARRSQVMGMVARQGLLLATIGIALGVPGVLGVTRVISGALSDFVAVEPATVIGMAAVLAAVTLLASWMPARKAANVDPVVALRMD